MWTIEYSDEAVKALNRPRSDLARRIRDKIRQVAVDPCAPDNTLKPLDGKPAFAVIPWELWLKVRDLIEDRDDEALYDAAKARIRETFPAAVVDALLDGANPVKVFREHRRLTQRELAQAASIAPLYLSQIENGHRTGSLETLRVLAAALKVDRELLISPGTTISPDSASS